MAVEAVGVVSRSPSVVEEAEAQREPFKGLGPSGLCGAKAKEFEAGDSSPARVWDSVGCNPV